MKLLTVHILLIILLFVSCSKTDSDLQLEEDPILHHQSEYIIVLGDLQIYTSQILSLPYLHRTMDWINTQKYYGKSINCILQVGDITNNNSYTHWERFYDCTYPITYDIQYIACTGNHDYDWNEEGRIYDRTSTMINSYAAFSSTCQNIIDYFENDKIENIVVANTIHGERYDIIALEFAPRTEVVKWAADYVSDHHDRKFILMTHEFLTRSGKRVSSSEAEWQMRNSSWSSPEDIWQKLVKNNDNIVCVLCGHNGFSSQLYSKNTAGRDVPQILFNLQYQENGGDGMIQLWEFPEQSDSVSVRVYNTIKRKFHTDPSTSFKFRYRY